MTITNGVCTSIQCIYIVHSPDKGSKWECDL